MPQLKFSSFCDPRLHFTYAENSEKTKDIALEKIIRHYTEVPISTNCQTTRTFRKPL